MNDFKSSLGVSLSLALSHYDVNTWPCISFRVLAQIVCVSPGDPKTRYSRLQSIAANDFNSARLPKWMKKLLLAGARKKKNPTRLIRAEQLDCLASPCSTPYRSIPGPTMRNSEESCVENRGARFCTTLQMEDVRMRCFPFCFFRVNFWEGQVDKEERVVTQAHASHFWSYRGGG